MNKPIVIAVIAVLVGGSAMAAYQSRLFGDYADIVKVDEITKTINVKGEVLDATPITESRSGPREVCEDKVVEYQVQPKDPNKIAGTAIGAVAGGLLGNQIGGGTGKTIATVAGVAGGAYAGRKIQENQQEANARTESRVERSCQTITETRDEVVGYEVTYVVDGETTTQRFNKKPGATVSLGKKPVVVAYDVTYRYKDQVNTLRMKNDPGEVGGRLPVKDGAVVVDSEG
ncbi:MAG: glycine zipper 2TM domain-containing protein [Xanthomonadaceae bacterium]|nr:glycine zipper 2TM domain-containing protein [Xanthomonadaceae bacterium]MDP2185719.1 glycine zipper 2TM domain-containing protein [Xanthomonadales bacterium]MDZ4115002.1 glycine zipper 2TM domain-containing protein [Xanthomonadaceae bacterium]MDZ4378088.1 glycine zipper 2TM domain-containing protein [Xanthomonadaceae bacterium]